MRGKDSGGGGNRGKGWEDTGNFERIRSQKRKRDKKNRRKEKGNKENFEGKRKWKIRERKEK